MTRRTKIVGGIVAFVLLAIATTFAAAGFFDRDAFSLFQPIGARSKVAGVFFSGDMGLRYGMGGPIARALAARGVEVVGVNSPTLFSTRRTLGETNAIVAGIVKQALVKSKATRLVLIGQSYGADVLQTGLAALPADLRGKVGSVLLIVPGKAVFLRADPTEWVYHGTPDSMGIDTTTKIDWVPITCIYGVAERDSLCPTVRMPNFHAVPMPGGHFLAHDTDGLIAHVLAAIVRDLPGALKPPVVAS